MTGAVADTGRITGGGNESNGYEGYRGVQATRQFRLRLTGV